MKRTLTTIACASLAAAILASPGASAQGPRGMMSGMGMMGMGYGMMGDGCPGIAGRGQRGGMMGGPGMMHGRGYDSDKADGLLKERLTELKKELGVGEKQEDAWKAYAEAVEARFTTMQGMHDAMHKAMFEGNAIERMEVRISMMENMLDAMKALVPAVKALYAVLPDDKKDKANTLLGGCGMM